MSSEGSVSFLGLFDVVLIVVAAPIMLLIGASPAGYAIGGGAWVVLRLVGLGVDRFAESTPDARTQVSVRLGYMLGRLFALAFAVILARGDGRNAGLTALALIAVGFTIQLVTAALNRPRSR
jgi:hypothetical protein